MEVMNRTGITIYLKASADDLLYRLNFNKQKRPLIKDKSSEELREFIELNLKKREPFYNQAKLIFDVPSCSTKKDMNQWIEELSVEIMTSDMSV